jgi:taurine--2-oxoglutarate transaminase
MPALLARLRELGVHAFGRYNILLVTPPLTIARDEIELGAAALQTALAELATAA